MSEKTHYIGRIVIEAVTVTTPETTGGRYSDSTPKVPLRTKHTVATVTLGSATLPELTERIGHHLDLLEDGGDVDA